MDADRAIAIGCMMGRMVMEMNSFDEAQITELNLNAVVAEKFNGCFRKLAGVLMHGLILCMESLFGALTGGLAGGAIGWMVGSVYQNCTESGLDSSFEAVRFWYHCPVIFACYGTMIGAGIGALVLLGISVYKSSTKRLD